MSSYYMFYLAKKTDEGKIKIVGPAVLAENGEFRIKPGVIRSRSYIEWEDWGFMNCLPVEKMANDDFTKVLCTSDHSWGSEPNIQSDAYYCSFAEIARQAERHSWGLKVGYTSLNEVDYVAENNYCLEDKYEIEFRSADMIAELQPEQRKDYGKVAFLATNSVGYIASQIVDAFHELVSWSNGYYVVCVFR